MPGLAPIRLQPTAPDLAAARVVARHASAPMERTTRVVTWLADEKIVLAGVAVVFAYCHLALRTPGARRCANQMAVEAAVAAAAPHLLKSWVDRERPDRKVVGLRRHGIPRSGQRWDSFPSGHAVHLGALAAVLDRFAPRRWRPLVWPAATALAATRILLLAHYLSDVAAGLALGVLIDRLVSGVAWRPARP
jgi:membrane-associated phospholipid phosphatase